MDILGIDIGGSGIKGAVVDAETGELLTRRRRVDTPEPSTPQAVAEVVNGIVHHFNWTGPMGCTFPAVIRNGVICSAANVDSLWIGTDAPALFERGHGMPDLDHQRRRRRGHRRDGLRRGPGPAGRCPPSHLGHRHRLGFVH